MKKLEVTKILLLVSIPIWVACGNTKGQSDITTTKNGNEITFIAKRVAAPEGGKGLVRLKDGEDLNNVATDFSFEEGGKGYAAADEKIAAAEVDAGKRAVNSIEPSAGELDEGGKGYTESSDEGGKGIADKDLDEGKRAVNSAELDEGGKGKMALLQQDLEVLSRRVSELLEGGKGKMVAAELDEGGKGKLADIQKNMNELSRVILELEEGGKGFTEEQVDEFLKRYNEFEKSVNSIAGAELEEGGKGKFALVKNVLTLEGKVSEEQFKESQMFYLVVNGQEKYEIKINPETLTYGAKFELSDEDMKKMVIEFVFGKDVMTFLVQDGELQMYNK